MTWLCVALGAAVGAPMRHVVSTWLDGRLVGGPGDGPGDGPVIGLPWGTLAVNSAGSLLLGWFAARALDGPAWALLAVGFCGGLTTYSSFAVQTVALGWRRGSVYAALTVAVGLAACAAGWTVGR